MPFRAHQLVPVGLCRLCRIDIHNLSVQNSKHVGDAQRTADMAEAARFKFFYCAYADLQSEFFQFFRLFFIKHTEIPQFLIRATPLFLAASRTAAATVSATRLSKAAGII